MNLHNETCVIQMKMLKYKFYKIIKHFSKGKKNRAKIQNLLKIILSFKKLLNIKQMNV